MVAGFTGLSRRGLALLVFSLLIPTIAIAWDLNIRAWEDAHNGVGIGFDPDFQRMEQNADLIVAGHAYFIAYIPFSHGKGFHLLLPDQILKGGSSNLLDRIPRMLILNGWRPVEIGIGTDGIFFLKSAGTNLYASVDESFAAFSFGCPEHGIAPMPDDIAEPGSDLLETFASQEVKTLSSSGQAILNGGKNEVGIVPVDWMRMRHKAQYTLRCMPEKIAVPLLKAELEKTTDPQSRLRLTKCLADFKVYDYIEQYKSILMSDKPPLDPSALVGNLRSISDERYVPLLTDLLVSKNASVREAAACGLQYIGTRSVVKPLATIGIFDSLQTVRWHSMRALAHRLYMPEHSPPPELLTTESGRLKAQNISTKERPYLNFWRNYSKVTFPTKPNSVRKLNSSGSSSTRPKSGIDWNSYGQHISLQVGYALDDYDMWFFPTFCELNLKDHEEGKIVLAFKLEPSGSLCDVRIQQSSGSQHADRKAIELLKHATFDPPPLGCCEHCAEYLVSATIPAPGTWHFSDGTVAPDKPSLLRTQFIFR